MTSIRDVAGSEEQECVGCGRTLPMEVFKYRYYGMVRRMRRCHKCQIGVWLDPDEPLPTFNDEQRR